MISKILTTLVIIYTLAIQTCEREKKPFTDIDTSTVYHFGDTLKIWSDIDFDLTVNNIKSKNKRTIDSTIFRIGENNLNFEYSFESKNKQAKRKVIVYPKNTPIELKYKVINTYNHGTDIYTEGLELYKGKIYESGGEYKKSKLIKYDIGSEEKIEFYEYDDDIFAEGITILNDKIYGLTYRKHKILTLNPDDLSLIDIRNTPIDFEGWGMTNDGKNLIMSDGTNNVYFLDPNSYSIQKILQVYNNKGPIKYVNELEYVDGLLFANVFTKDNIIVIDYKTGAVLYNLKFDNIAKKHKRQGVLNGIAKLNNGNFLVTGKHWNKMYEVSIEGF